MRDRAPSLKTPGPSCTCSWESKQYPVPTERAKSGFLLDGQMTVDSFRAIARGLFARTPPSCKVPRPGRDLVRKKLWLVSKHALCHVVLDTHNGAATLHWALIQHQLSCQPRLDRERGCDLHIYNTRVFFFVLRNEEVVRRLRVRPSPTKTTIVG